LPAARSALAGVEFLSATVVVFAGESGVTAYDLEAGLALWSGAAAAEIAVSGDRAVVAAMNEARDGAAIYAADGRKLGEVTFGGKTARAPVDGSFINPHDVLFALDGTGSRLAVSFADGSLSVFDTATGLAKEIYPPSSAIHFSGGFCEDALAFAAVGTEPYFSEFYVYDMVKWEPAARYSSDSSHFTPLAGPGGIYVSFEDRIMAADAVTGDLSYVASAGGRVETFRRSGNTLLVCESSGPYRFTGAGEEASGPVRAYDSGYACHFADIAGAYAITGSHDAKTLRVLKNDGGAGEKAMGYDPGYPFSEAKIHPSGRAVFYSYRGMRICGADGAAAAETSFPEPLSVLDTQYDEAGGNVAVLYAGALRLYSGRDGTLLMEKYGVRGGKSVVYTPFGVSVLDEGRTVTLYELTEGQAVVSQPAESGASCAVAFPGGGCVSVRQGLVFFGGREIGAGELIGAGRTEDGFAFAVSDGAEGHVFFVRDGALTEGFTFPARGSAEAYFAGGAVFISPAHGDAAAYARDGSLLRVFEESGYMADAGMLGEYIVLNYVMASSGRVSFLLDPATLETVAVLPEFLGVLDGALILDDKSGSLRSVRMAGLRELIALARERLAGRTLTPEEEAKYKAG
jgi:hypothetical protein